MWLIVGTFAAFLVFGRVLQGIRGNGVQTRPDLLSLTDVLVAGALLVVPISVIASHLLATGATDPEAPAALPANLLAPMLGQLVSPMLVILMMIARDMSPVDFFGIRRVGVLRACLLGLGFAMVALPLTTMVKQITLMVTQSQEAPQNLVRLFNDAVGQGNWSPVWQIAISATLIAPVVEEILFRGYFYPVISRGVGRILSALVVAVLFGAAHDTLTDIPGLAVLAICLTLAYERSGSLLVPIFTHAWFNGISLLALYLHARYGGAL